MRVVHGIGLIVVLSCISTASSAFDRCDQLLATPKALQDFVFAKGVRNAPVKYFDRAKSVRIETGQGPGGLIPHASRDATGRPLIFYSTSFPPTLCRIAIATFVVNEIEDAWRPFAEASRRAGQCADSGRPFDTCLVEFGRDLQLRYQARFAAFDSRRQRLAYEIYLDAAGQIAAHEYGHHLLKHQQKVGAGALARIDAEFEADFYAMSNAVQSGQIGSAMYYFFKGLADVESYSKTLKYSDYESGACRATNVNDITGVFQIYPLVVIDAVNGGGRFDSNSPAFLRATAKQMQSEKPPAPSSDSCGRLRGAVMREAHEEMLRIVTAVADYGDILFVDRRDAGADFALRGPRVYELIDRLRSESSNFRYVRGIAAQIISRLIQRVEFGGTRDALVRQLDDILAGFADDILSGDYGRILKVKGLNVLYETSGAPLGARMAEAKGIFESAVTFLPESSESWMNLAFIALAHGRCGKAADLSRQSALYAAKGSEDMANEFRDRMDEAVATNTCERQAKRFLETFTR